MMKRPAEAENEHKTQKISLRIGPRARAILYAAAAHHGVPVALYLRNAALDKALGEGFGAIGVQAEAESGDAG